MGGGVKALGVLSLRKMKTHIIHDKSERQMKGGWMYRDEEGVNVMEKARVILRNKAINWLRRRVEGQSNEV